MSEAILQPTHTSDAANGLKADALRAQDWAGEPLLHPGEEPEQVLAPGTARRAALDEALAEIESGRSRPSPAGKSVSASCSASSASSPRSRPRPPRAPSCASTRSTRWRGCSTELIAANQRHAEEEKATATGRRRRARAEDAEEEDEVAEDDPRTSRGVRRRGPRRRPPLPLPPSDRLRQDDRRGGFVEAARTLGVLILTHRRLLVSQFKRDLTTEGYGDRFTDFIDAGKEPLRGDPITIQTYAWFARHADSLSREAYQLVICDEAHTALGEKTSAAIRSFPEPIYIGMTATEQLIAKQVSDVFPASVDDLPLADAARRGLIAPLRCLRVPPAAAINSVPIVGGDFEERALAAALDHQALNQAAASLYRERFDTTPGIVYAAGVDHAYNLAQEFRAAGLKAEAVSGRTPPVKLAETLAAYERGEINVLINAMLLAEGWNSPRATVCMHLAPTASKRVYQQRIGRIMRTHPRKEAGSSSTSRRSRPRTTNASSRCTPSSTPTSTARERASRRRRAAASSAAPAAGSRRRPGSSRSPRTSRAGSP